MEKEMGIEILRETGGKDKKRGRTRESGEKTARVEALTRREGDEMRIEWKWTAHDVDDLDVEDLDVEDLDVDDRDVDYSDMDDRDVDDRDVDNRDIGKIDESKIQL